MPSTRVSDPVSVPAAAAARRAPLVSRLLSLSGVAPLGAFVILHLVVNARALRGQQAYVAAAGTLGRLPGIWLLEGLLVFAPLLLHATVGVWLVVTRRPLAEPSPYPRALGIAVRVTALLSLAFLALHVPELRLRAFGPGPDPGEQLTLLAADLSSTWHGVPWRGALYLVGTAAVTFHLAAGAWGYFARIGRGATPGARRAAAWCAAGLGAAMWLLFVDVVVFHATGARLLGTPAAERASLEPCPPVGQASASASASAPAR